MYLVQLLLPLRDDEGKPFEKPCYARVRDELTQGFGVVSPPTSARRPRACGKHLTATSSGTMSCCSK